MIEFIIPLNLPVRAIVVTERAANPPQWLMGEMTRWADGQKAHSSTAGEITVPPVPAPPTEVEKELESLRGQRALFHESILELRHATKLVEKRLEGMVHEFQLATVELAHAISAKLIFEAVESGRFPIENLVHEVITRLDTTATTVVRLHPDDLEFIQQYPKIDHSTNESSLQFVADSSLSRGDCKAKSGEISVVYELKRQVEEIRRQLLSTVNGHAET